MDTDTVLLVMQLVKELLLNELARSVEVICRSIVRLKKVLQLGLALRDLLLEHIGLIEEEHDGNVLEGDVHVLLEQVQALVHTIGLIVLVAQLIKVSERGHVDQDVDILEYGCPFLSVIIVVIGQWLVELLYFCCWL